MTWHESVEKAIERITSRTKNRIFSRQDLVDSELTQIVSETTPSGIATPEQTLTRVLQELRNKGMLDVEAPGIYRLMH